LGSSLPAFCSHSQTTILRSGIADGARGLSRSIFQNPNDSSLRNKRLHSSCPNSPVVPVCDEGRSTTPSNIGEPAVPLTDFPRDPYAPFRGGIAQASLGFGMRGQQPRSRQDEYASHRAKAARSALTYTSG